VELPVSGLLKKNCGRMRRQEKGEVGIPAEEQNSGRRAEKSAGIRQKSGISADFFRNSRKNTAE
jgi:hypothetical protein